MYFEKPRELMESLMKSMATIIQVTLIEWKVQRLSKTNQVSRVHKEVEVRGSLL